jgi:hypothetical protein
MIDGDFCSFPLAPATRRVVAVIAKASFSGPGLCSPPSAISHLYPRETTKRHRSCHLHTASPGTRLLLSASYCLDISQTLKTSPNRPLFCPVYLRHTRNTPRLQVPLDLEQAVENKDYPPQSARPSSTKTVHLNDTTIFYQHVISRSPQGY